jgi:hypothetical protein
MSEKAHGRKTIIIFLAISIFAYSSAKRFKDINVQPIEAQEYTVSERVTATTGKDDLEQDIFVELDEDFNLVRQVYPDLVLSEQDVTTECRTADLVYSSKKICSYSSANLTEDLSDDGDGEVGEMIRKDANISLRQIIVPPLFSGSPTMDNEVRQIHKDDEGKYHWTLKPAGEMLSRRSVESSTYPGDEKTKEILDKGDSTRNEPFGMKYTLDVGGQAEGGGESNFTVDQYYRNDCSELCDNPSSGTLENYNVRSSLMLQQPPGYYEDTNEETQEDGIEICDEDTTFKELDIKGTSPKGCSPSLKDIVISFVKRITNALDANACNEEEVEGEEGGNCVSTASIVIIMESPWGTKEDCGENGQCVNEFNDLRSGNFKYPKEDKSGDTYVLTDCIADVDGKRTTLKCAWDIRYIVDEVEFQATDNLPGEEYPDTMEYLDFQVHEAENRTDQPIVM